MPFNRRNLTASSQVMMIVYPVFSFYIGAAYILGDPARTATPSFDSARSIMPMWSWGIAFLAAGFLELAAWVRGRRPWMILALCFSLGVCAVWSGNFVASIFLSPDASITGPVVWGFIAAAHIASLRSLTRDRVVVQ